MTKKFLLPDGYYEAIFDSKNHSIMVLGGTDTGKTTLIEQLVTKLCTEFNVGIVDCDMGQSHIGPPTTIAWGMVRNFFPGWDRIEIEDMYFTGNVSPRGNLLPSICGAKIIYEKAKKKVDKVIIDTTGLVLGPLGKVLKESKIELIGPDVILALQREGELEHILSAFEHMNLKIFRLQVPPFVVQKTVVMREEYRREKFHSYFSKDFCEVEIQLDKVSIRRIGSPEPDGKEGDQLVALKDGDGNDLVLGILKEMDGRRMRVMIPYKDISQIRGVVIGGKVTL